MTSLLLWVIIYCLTASYSIVLLGDRALISGNLLNFRAIFNLILHWKFFAAMFLAVFSRMSFVMVNNALLKIPEIANTSTTVTTFILTISYVFVIVVNSIHLKERLSLSQGFGAALVVAGIFFLFQKKTL